VLLAAVAASTASMAWAAPAQVAPVRADAVPAATPAQLAPTRAADAPVSTPAQAPESIGVVVRFRQPATAPLGAQLLSASTDASAAPTNRAEGLYAFTTPGTTTDEQYAMQLMLTAPGVAYAEPNYVRHISTYVAPTDPAFADTATWAEYVNNVPTHFFFGAKHWWLDAIKAPSAWAIGQGDTYPTHGSASSIKVAVLDVGIYLNHPEFSAGTVTAGKDELASYDPNTGNYTTDFDITPDATSSVSFAAHGTGTSAAVGAPVDGAGMVGAGWNPQIVGYKVAGPITAPWSNLPAGSLVILDGAVANGIYDAVNAGCKVINMSLGGTGYSQTYQDAVTYAHAHGVVVVASSGNDGDATVNYPAACTYATGVGAVTRVGGSVSVNGTITRASFSAYGAGVVDLTAPGELFYTATQPGYSGTGSVPGYDFWNGTSFSSPAVAGAIAYLWRAMPDLTNDQIVSYVESSSADLGTAGRDDYYGYGMVDMQAAYNRLIADYPMLARPSVVASPYVASGQSVSWNAVSGYNVGYQVSIDGTLRSTQAGTTYALPVLSDGAHLISILPTSSRNWNSSSLATKTLTLDSTAPSVGSFSRSGGGLSWAVTEANPYTVRAYIDTATPAAVASNTLSVAGLAVGAHTLYVNATDSAGNSSGWVSWAFGIPPAAPVVPSVAVTDALSATVSWPAVSGATSYDYTVAGGSTQSTGGPSFVASGLSAGVTQIAVRSVVASLSSAWATATITDNVVVPGTPAITAPANVSTPGVTSTWSAAANARSYEYRLNGGGSTATTATTASFVGLPMGTNAISVRSLNNLAQSAWATATVIYAVPPVVPSVVVTDALAATVSWPGVSGAASYQYTVGGGSVQGTAGPAFALAGLTGGVVAVQVRTVLAGGETSVWATATVTDNVVLPATPAVSAPAGVGVPSVAVTWPAAADARAYEYRLNGGSATATTALSATVSGLQLGANSVSVRSLNNLAQSSWATASVSYAIPAPVVSAPATVWATTATAQWSAVSGATSYDYAVNGGASSSVAATGAVVAGLVFGDNSVTVRARIGADAGAWGSATVTRAHPSPTTLTLSPLAATVTHPDASTTLSGLLSAPAETYRLQSSPDGLAWTDTGQSRTTTATPAAASFVVPVAASGHHRLVFDGDERWAPATSAVATVTYVPAVEAPVVPSVVVTDTLSATVAWPAVAEAVGYEYEVNGGSTQTTSGPAFVASGLTPGANTVRVRTLAASARTSAWATATITVALHVPGVPQLSAPATVTVPNASATWPAVGDALGYEYRLNGGSATATTALSASFPGLVLGSNSISVRSLNNLSRSAWATATVFYGATYDISVAPAVHGTISPSTTQTVAYGSDSATFTITPAAGYHVQDVLVDGVSQGPVTAYKFAGVAADHTIAATFSLTVPVARLSGANRYATAIAIAQAAFPGYSGVKHVIVASGDSAHLPDALTAGGLAGAYNAPVLLVAPTYLDPAVKAAIQAMPSGLQVHVIGGTPSVSAGVAGKIKALPNVRSVERISGSDRYATAAAVAAKMRIVLGTGLPHTVLITSGGDLLDPLIASTASFSQHFPVLLVARTSVPKPTTSALAALDPTTKRYIVGGPGSVSDGVRTALKVDPADRIAGADINGDAVAFAERARAEKWLAYANVGFAAAVPDAATGGVLMGKRSGSMLLVGQTAVPPVTSGFLSANKADIQNGFVFGGAPTVSESVRLALLAYLE
jgi:putative cell wall-binding protein